MKLAPTGGGAWEGDHTEGKCAASTRPTRHPPRSTARCRTVIATKRKNGNVIYALVLNVGPWPIDARRAVSRASIPPSSSGVGNCGFTARECGNVISERVWPGLGLDDDDQVELRVL